MAKPHLACHAGYSEQHTQVNQETKVKKKKEKKKINAVIFLTAPFNKKKVWG